MVQVYTDPRYKFDKNHIKEEASRYLERRGFPRDYLVNTIFVGKRKMKRIEEDYHKKNKQKREALPVLSFSYLKPDARHIAPQDERGDNLIGEVVICYPQAVLLAAERNKRVDDVIVELIKHGIETIIRA